MVSQRTVPWLAPSRARSYLHVHQSAMNDSSLNDDELLAQAIALSMESANESTTGPQAVPTGRQPAPQKPEKVLEDSGLGGPLEAAQSVPGSVTSTTLPPVRLTSYHSVEDWQPNRECLDLVMGMGISQNAALRALYYTGNDNPELAVSWVFENINNPDLHKPFQPMPVPNQPQDTGAVCHSYDDQVVSDEEDEEEVPKMVFVVNSELRMGVGKIAAQVGHATLGLHRLLQQSKAGTPVQVALKKWEETGSKKVVLKGQHMQHLLDLKRKAYELRLVNVIVHDAGRTQVQSGSLTVLALFGKGLEVDQVTGKLKLL